MRPAAIALCSLLLVGACGVEDQPDPEADRERAEAAVLTAEEMPTGFQETAAEEDEEGPGDQCLEDSEAGLTDADVDEARTARATREFEAEPGANVEAEVAVFESDDVPSSLVDVLGEEAVLECLTDAVQQEASGDPELSITAADVGAAPTVPDDLGDQRAAVRMELTIEHSSGQSFDFVADLYVVRVDRAVATLTVSQLADPLQFAEGDAQAALEAMATRLEDGD